MSEANKLDTGKIKYHLIPTGALREVARVYSFGALVPKYGPWNWHKGLTYSRLYDAALRHIEARRSGEQFSEHEHAGSNCYHLAHAIFNLLAMLQFDLEGRDADLNDLIPPALECLETKRECSPQRPIPAIRDFDQEKVARDWQRQFPHSASTAEPIDLADCGSGIGTGTIGAMDSHVVTSMECSIT